MKQSCKTCRFAMKEGEQFYCHRFPPQINLENGGIHSMFPPVPAGSWCGEYKRDLSRLFGNHGS